MPKTSLSPEHQAQGQDFLNNNKLIKDSSLLDHFTASSLSNIIIDLNISLVASEVEVGSGSLPLERLESMALEFKPKNISPTKLARRFRQASVPVVGYINENKLFIDLKALIPGQEKDLVEVINDLF